MVMAMPVWLSNRSPALSVKFGLHLPVILEERPHIRHRHRQPRSPRRQRKLARPSAVRPNLRRRQPRLQPLLRNLVGIQRAKINCPLYPASVSLESRVARSRAPNVR